MAFFTAKPMKQSTGTFLSAPQAQSRKQSQRLLRPRDELDEFLSSDLDLEESFASNMSLNSPPREQIPLADEDCQPMDISPPPAPAAKAIITRSSLEDSNKASKPSARPRAFTSAAPRAFGRDMSNAASPSVVASSAANKSGSSLSQSKRTQRAALPLEWMSTGRSSQAEQSTQRQGILPPPAASPSSSDAMDVDTSYIAPPTAELSPAPQSAAPTITGFKTLFFDDMSPARYPDEQLAGPLPKKRRSHSPEHVSRIHQEAQSSSPGLVSSPSQRKLERISSGPLLASFSKPSLQGLGTPPSSGNKRPRRPALSAMVHPTDVADVHSAYPVLSPGDSNARHGLPPARRAFSAMLPPSAAVNGNEPSSDESSFDVNDMSSPAQAYAQRQHAKTIRRCDGTDDFRPMTGATAMVMNESPLSKLVSTGMPGFGDNEAHGKILPCHRVKEDGLMRIKPETLDQLLDGAFDSHIANYHVIDCRFDYEYNGGHIPGAINVNTTSGIEEFLLGAKVLKPKPSTSSDGAKKTVLVFHCEFSVKRAPTFAKHLRSKDRSMNNHVYPRVHYPEVYILEGGYCNYFKASAARCLPSAYVQMDDPNFATSRKEDMDQFRNKTRFGRTKSYAYGDAPAKSMLAQKEQQPKRNTAPSSGGPLSLFAAAANAARGRRGGPTGLVTLAEDGNTTAHSDDEETDLGDSPCPPPNKVVSKALGRKTLQRAETYGPMTMNY